MHIYHKRLLKRNQIKKFVIEHEIIDVQKQFRRELEMDEDERTIRNLLKPFMRFLSVSDFEKLVQCQLQQKRIEEIIDRLQLIKEMGFERLDEFEKVVFSDTKLERIRRQIQQMSETYQHSKVSKRRIRKNQDAQESKMNHYLLTRNYNDLATFVPDKANAHFNLCYVEKEFCTRNQINPDWYFKIKQYCIRKCLKNQFLTNDDKIYKTEK